MKITDDCINCGACAVECPTEAVYGPGESWEENGKYFNPISNEHYFIVTKICNECAGFNKIRCIAVCPMDAIKKMQSGYCFK